jgi:hypothetical protein
MGTMYKRAVRTWVVAMVMFSLPACGGSDSVVTGDPLALEWGPIEVDPSVEGTRCVVKRLKNSERVYISGIENRLSSISHHLVIYRVTDTEERLDPYPCSPFVDTLDPDKGAPLMITQKKADTLTLPSGVAFTFEPHQMVRLELHYLNVSDEAREARSTTEFVALPPAEFEHEADFLFTGNVDIRIEPRSSATLGPTYFPLPPELNGVKFFGITGHEHQWGTNVTVSTAAGPAEAETPVYVVENFAWNEPETVIHDPPFVVPDDGGFRFTCEWMNLSDEVVKFGESTNEEMCFFWAYYYPSRGARVCVHSDELFAPEVLDLCCPGDIRCALIQ